MEQPSQEKISIIRDLFPSWVTKRPGENGQTLLVIDFERARQEILMNRQMPAGPNRVPVTVMTHVVWLFGLARADG